MKSINLNDSHHESANIYDDDDAENSDDDFIFEHGQPMYKLSFVPLKEQMKSPTYWYILIYGSPIIMFSNFFMATAQARLEQFGTDEEAANATRILSIILPASFIFAPVIGYLLDKQGLLRTTIFIQVLGALRASLQMVPVIEVQYLTFIIFSIWRASFYSTYIDAFFRIFGQKNFGTLYGVNMFFAACVNGLVYALSYLALNTFEGNFRVIDSIELSIAILAFAWPYYLQCYGPRLWMKKGDVSRLIEEAEENEETKNEK